MAFSLLIAVLAVATFPGSADAVVYGSGFAANGKNRLDTSSVRLAQGYGGLDNWQSRSFRNIDRERRLDRLLRKYGKSKNGRQLRKKNRPGRAPKRRRAKKVTSQTSAPQLTVGAASFDEPEASPSRAGIAARSMENVPLPVRTSMPRLPARPNDFAANTKRRSLTKAMRIARRPIQTQTRNDAAEPELFTAALPLAARKPEPKSVEPVAQAKSLAAPSRQLAQAGKPLADTAPKKPQRVVALSSSTSKQVSRPEQNPAAKAQAKIPAPRKTIVKQRKTEPTVTRAARQPIELAEARGDISVVATAIATAAVVPVTDYCESNAYWSKAQNRCLCLDGFIERGGVCVRPRAPSDKSEERLPSHARFEVVRDPLRLQTCLRKAGYFRGNLTGRLNTATFRAFQRFRRKLRLTHRPEDLFDPDLQQVLFSICGEVPKSRDDQFIDAYKVDEKSKTLVVARRAYTKKPGGVLLDASKKQPLKVAGLQKPKAVTPLPVNEVDEPPAPLYTAATSSSPPRLFAEKPTISDLFAAGPSAGKSCAPAPRVAALPQSNVPVAGHEPPLITGSISRSSPPQAVSSTPKFARFGRAERTDSPCLPSDLLDQLTSMHGVRKELAVCRADCQPAPERFSNAQKRVFARQYDISWCGSDCLSIAEPLPVSDVLRIEREANVHVCMRPQERLAPAVKKGLQRGGVTGRIRALYDKLPGGFGNEGNIAVLIGNRNYEAELPVHDAGHINASAMKALLIEQLGYAQENVIALQDARKKDFERLFGSDASMEGELRRRLAKTPNAQLLIYFSGHASSKGLGLENYLLPVDAKPGREAETAYPLELLYEKLRALDARSTMMFLDAGFNEQRSHLVQPPNLAERKVTVAPVVPVPGLALFTATEGDQKPLVDAETGIGLFTRYLIEGLAGKADQRPVGNGDSVIDSLELHVHLARNVRLAARKTLGLMQNPTLSRTENMFLSQLSKRPRSR